MSKKASDEWWKSKNVMLTNKLQSEACSMLHVTSCRLVMLLRKRETISQTKQEDEKQWLPDRNTVKS